MEKISIKRYSHSNASNHLYAMFTTNDFIFWNFIHGMNEISLDKL